MLQFEKEVLFLGYDVKVSKKTGKEYKIVHCLIGNESVGLYFEGVVPEGLVRFDKVLIEFNLNLGRYTNVSINQIIV